MRLVETIHHGSYRNRRTVDVDRVTGETMAEALRGSPYAGAGDHAADGERMAAAIRETGRFELGWADWELARADCGHIPAPHWYADGTHATVMRRDGRPERVDVTGQAMTPGTATLPDGRTVCYPCADDWQREDMRTANRFTAYLASDGRTVTTWTGGKLGRVTSLNRNARQTFAHVVDVHGAHWAGIGPAESGTYVSLRRVGGAR